MSSEARAIRVAVSKLAQFQATLASMQEQNRCDREGGRPISYWPHEFEQLPKRFGLEE